MSMPGFMHVATKRVIQNLPPGRRLGLRARVRDKVRVRVVRIG